MKQVDHHLPGRYRHYSRCCDHPAEVGYLESTRHTISGRWDMLSNNRYGSGSHGVHNTQVHICTSSQDSSVSIVMNYGLESRDLIPDRGLKFFSCPQHPDRLLRPIEPPIRWVPGTLSPVAKHLGREADHSLPSSAEVKNGGAYVCCYIHPHGMMHN
jgi:hypothetical protein